jgi:DNA-binding transcriptional LysR family regulator
VKLNHLGLTAFHQVALSLNMTSASKVLGLTQSALSQRIASLEDELETALFIREGKSLQLTETGLRLKAFCHEQLSLEEELLHSLKGHESALAGVIRIGAFSSILRSFIMPKLTVFLRKHQQIVPDVRSYQVSELEDVLKSNRADLVVTDYSMNKKGIAEVLIGYEEYVVIESTRYPTPSDIYLDHGPEDLATEKFFAKQKIKPNYRRSYLGDVYGILEGVEQGLGRATMSKHLISDNKKIKIVPGFKEYKLPIILHYYERPYYSHLFKSVIEQLQKPN